MHGAAEAPNDGLEQVRADIGGGQEHMEGLRTVESNRRVCRLPVLHKSTHWLLIPRHPSVSSPRSALRLTRPSTVHRTLPVDHHKDAKLAEQYHSNDYTTSDKYY